MDVGEHGRLIALYEAGAFPPELNQAIEQDVAGLDELRLELNPQEVAVS